MRKQIALFLVLAMMFCMIPCVSAAADTARLTLDAAFVDGNVQVTVGLEHVANVTNGRMTLRYDEETAAFAQADISSDLSKVSVNTKTSGEVSVAWVGSKFTQEDVVLATLIFVPVKAQDLQFTAACPELFAGREAVEVQEVSAAAAWNPFTDISGHWAEDEIISLWHTGLIQGVTATKFQPDGRLSRAMFVTILHRMAGSPAAEATADFTDVSAGRYYTQAVNWAVEAGIAKGTGYGEFKPHKDLNRQEMVTMLYRYAKAMDMDVSADDVLDQFQDADKLSAWAEDAMNWAVDQGLIHGMSKNRLAPGAVSTRAQVVTVLNRFLAE